MWGCRKSLRFCISLRIFPTTSKLRIFCRFKIFTATWCLVSSCWPTAGGKWAGVNHSNVNTHKRTEQVTYTEWRKFVFVFYTSTTVQRWLTKNDVTLNKASGCLEGCLPLDACFSHFIWIFKGLTGFPGDTSSRHQTRTKGASRISSTWDKIGEKSLRFSGRKHVYIYACKNTQREMLTYSSPSGMTLHYSLFDTNTHTSV